MTATNESEASGRSRRPARTGRRLRLFLLGLLVLAAGLAAAALWNLALRGETARRDIEARLSELTGMSVATDGGATNFQLLPAARLSLARVRIGDGASEQVLAIDRVTAELDLWQALLGRTAVKRLVLVRPELLSSQGFIARAARGAPGNGPAGRGGDAYAAVSGALGAFLSRFGAMTSLEVRDGVFRMGSGAASLGVSDADLVMSWPAAGSPARLSGSYVWNGQPAEIALEVAAPLAFLAGAPSAVDFGLASPALGAAFDGEASLGAAGHLAGRLKLDVPSLGRAVRWLGNPRAVWPDFGPMAVEADLGASGRTLNLDNARIAVDGFVGTGALEVVLANGRRPSFGGTLAFDRLNLDGIAKALAPLPDGPLGLGRPIAVGFIDRLDLDLRVSAADGAIGPLTVADLAATVKFKDGAATLDVGDAALLGGQGQMRMTIDVRGAVPSMKGSVALKGIDAGRLFSAMGVSQVGVTGLADIAAELASPVTNWGDIFERNRLGVTISARGGILSGFDPKVFLAGGTRSFEFATNGGSVPFRTIEAVVASRGARVALQAIRVMNDAGAFEASGVLSTATNDVDVTGRFEPAGVAPPDAAALTGAKPIGFTMRGAWPNPDVTTAPILKRM